MIAASGVVQAQPYGEPDPYTLPPGYNQVTGYDQPGQDPAQDSGQYADPAADYPDQYEGPAHYETPPAQDYADAPYADDPPRAPAGDDRYATPGGYYNSGTARERSTYSRDGYVRSGESYSSRESTTSQEAYVGGEYRERSSDRDYADEAPRASVGTPVYVDQYGNSREGEASRYGDRSGYATSSSSASSSAYASSGRFGYQRRFNAFSVATEQSETSSEVRREDFGYVRRAPVRPYPWRNDDLHLDGASQLALTGGVEGSIYVASSSGGGYATASASASAYAGARAFAGARGGKGRRGHGGCGCGTGHGRH